MGRGMHKKTLAPKQRQDILPDGPAPLPPPRPLTPELEDSAPRAFLRIQPNLCLMFTEMVHTTVNTFGLSRLYYGRPAAIPDKYMTLGQSDHTALTRGSHPAAASLSDTTWPYPNMSSWCLGSWFWGSGDIKSKAGFKDLVKNVLLAPDFNVQELESVHWDVINNLLATDSAEGPYGGDGWKESMITIDIPTGLKRKVSETRSGHHGGPRSRTFDIPGLWYRSIPGLIQTVFGEDPAVRHWHFNPFKQFWNGASSKPQRVWDELFNSDAWIREHEVIQNLPCETGDTEPRCIAGLMFWSDATHLAQFGQAKLWPVYLFFGNQSKWLRCKPSTQACHHVAYLPGVHGYVSRLKTMYTEKDGRVWVQLPDSVQDFIHSSMEIHATDALMTHCQREIYHATLAQILDDDFVAAWEKGMVIDCYDGVSRCIFPWLFTWSADCPEK